MSTINPDSMESLFNDMPGDISFDTLFQPNEPATTQNPQEPSASPEAAPQAAPQVVPDWSRIETKTGSVYDTKDELIKGIEHKDTYIQELRSKLSQYEAPRQPQAQPEPQTSQEHLQSYINNPKRYLEELVKGAETDPSLYVNTQLGLVDERLNQVLSPVAGLIQEIVNERTERALVKELPDFQQVKSSDAFNQVLEQLPDLKQAIDGAKANFAFQDRLPGLYKVAYLAARGMQVPELLKAQQAAAPAPQPAPRQPVTGAPLMPPIQTGPTPSFATSEGRKAIMERLEQSGILDRRF